MTKKFEPRVVMLSVDELVPDAMNARTHDDEQVAEIAASIKEFGWTNPVLVDESSSIIAGHGRVLAARKLKQKSVPCIVIDHLSPAQKRAYSIADNKIALNAGWDNEMLRASIEQLRELNFDIDLTGFSEAELDVLAFTQDGATDPNAHWQGMPEYDQKDQMAYRTLYVHFADEQAVQDFAKLIGQALTEKTKYVWHPKQERVKAVDKEYGDATPE